MLVSKDTPCYFLTSVTHNRLPVFRTAKLANVMCKALAEARASAGFRIFAYAIMPDHLHIITDSARPESETLRYLKGISARRVLNLLKENGFETSLQKLRIEERDRQYKYSLWQHHSNTFAIKTEPVLMQKVNYVHRNPVEEGLADIETEYLYSSARFWRGCTLEDEPLAVDCREIKWRVS